MPLPWRVPTDQEAAELVRRIDQLFADFYQLIRAVILGQPRPLLPPVREENSDESNTVPDLLAQLGQEASKEGDAENEDHSSVR